MSNYASYEINEIVLEIKHNEMLIDDLNNENAKIKERIKANIGKCRYNVIKDYIMELNENDREIEKYNHVIKVLKHLQTICMLHYED